MKTVLKVTGEIIALVLPLYGLVKTSILDLNVAITVGLMSVIFLVCFEKLQYSLHPIRNAMAEIQRWLSDSFDFVPLHEIRPTGYIEEESPLKLTQLGKKVLEQSGAKQIIEDNYVELEAMIDEKHPNTAYDVQSYVSKLIAQLENEKWAIPIKNFAYENPRFDNHLLKLVDIQKTMVVYLRDKYLKKHQELLKDEKSN